MWLSGMMRVCQKSRPTKYVKMNQKVMPYERRVAVLVYAADHLSCIQEALTIWLAS